MIFSRFFKPKWKHNNPTERVEAISEFELSNAEHQANLNELLTSDESSLVRKAALLKLNQFDTYLKASRENSNKSVKTLASTTLNDAFNNKGPLTLNDEQRDLFIKQTDQTQLLEQCLFETEDSNLAKTIYERLDKPQLAPQLLVRSKCVQTQLFALAKIDDLATLEKSLKRIKSSEVHAKTSEIVEQLKQEAQRPVLLKKKTQMVLSKLLALKDVKDFEQVVTKQQTLLEEWSEYQKEFSILTNQEADDFTQRFNEIESKLAKLFEQAKEAYELEQQEQAHIAKVNQQTALLDDAIATISTLITSSVFENIELDEKDLNKQLHNLHEQTNNSLLHDGEKAQYIKQIEQLHIKLNQIPQIASAIAEATRLVTALTRMAIPTDLSELNEQNTVYKQWLSEWRANSKQIDDSFPESIETAYKELTGQWNKALAPLIEKQKSNFIYTQKKLSELKRLINGGRYKSAFGLHKKLSSLRDSLSEHHLSRLQRDYDWVDEKIAELNDWEAYIATPRKQALVEEIKNLALNPDIKVQEQAAQVKRLRKTWNTLGHADQEVDKALNEQFNLYCEQAFAPCREFYQEQEQKRAQNYDARLALIDALKGLLEQCQQDDVELAKVDSKLQEITRSWQRAGEVERDKYKALLAEYNQLLTPINRKVHQFHHDNAEAKTKLIEKAEQQLEEDINKAIEVVKTLQQNWKQVGFAGHRQDKALWQTFRKVNDEIFAKRDELKAKQKAEQNVQAENLNERLTQLTQTLNDSAEIKTLNTLLTDTMSLKHDFKESDVYNKGLLKSIEKLLVDIETKVDEIKQAKHKRQYSELLALVSDLSANSIDIDGLEGDERFQQLSHHWQKVLINAIQHELNDEKRALLTLEIEIIAGVPSPVEFEKERMKVQVELLSDKLNNASALGLDNKLEQWLAQGIPSKENERQITRLSSVFS